MKTLCLFSSDLHGKQSRYEALLKEIRRREPDIVLLGGDLLPHVHLSGNNKIGAEDFAREYLPRKFAGLRDIMGSRYPRVLLILGNDDPRYLETCFTENEDKGLWHYMHMRTLEINGYLFTGYAMVPPTPFQLKDWERYDVSRFVDPGCTDPFEGFRTVEPDADIEYATIQKDLETLARDLDMNRSVFLFHSPPYDCALDRAALDGMQFDHVPLDVHVGSIAIRRFIEVNQPRLTLHGHIHESTRLTGNWSALFGRTLAMNGATDSGDLCLITFDPGSPAEAARELISN